MPVERPPGTVDFEDFARACYAIERALEYGDYGPLLARLREGKALPDEQKLSADIIEKQVKRPRGQPKQHSGTQRLRYNVLALCVLGHQLSGSTLKVAVAKAKKETGAGESTIYAAVGQHRDLFVRCFPRRGPVTARRPK